jgi:hypothetical protein
MDKPLIQIDDQIREMTDEEYETYQSDLANYEPPAALREAE